MYTSRLRAVGSMDQAQTTSGVIGVIWSGPEGSVDHAPPLALTLTSPAAPVTSRDGGDQRGRRRLGGGGTLALTLNQGARPAPNPNRVRHG